MSESSTPYGSPCATPTRADHAEVSAAPSLLTSPPRPRIEETSTEPSSSSTPTHALNAPQEVRLFRLYLFFSTDVKTLTRFVSSLTDRVFGGELTRGQSEALHARGEMFPVLSGIVRCFPNLDKKKAICFNPFFRPSICSSISPHICQQFILNSS